MYKSKILKTYNGKNHWHFHLRQVKSLRQKSWRQTRTQHNTWHCWWLFKINLEKYVFGVSYMEVWGWCCAECTMITHFVPPWSSYLMLCANIKTGKISIWRAFLHYDWSREWGFLRGGDAWYQETVLFRSVMIRGVKQYGIATIMLLISLASNVLHIRIFVNMNI